MSIKANVQYLKGVGERRTEQLNNIGISTVENLLTYFPVNYEDRRNIKKIAMINDGDITLVRGKVKSHRLTNLRFGKKLLKILIGDATGSLTLICFNQAYLKETLEIGTDLFIYGKFSRTHGGLEISNFTYEKIKMRSSEENFIHTKRIVPVYKLTSGINQKWLRRTMYYAVQNIGNEFIEYIPPNIIARENFYEINNAIKTIHFPETIADSEKARVRLIFGEFLVFQTALALKKLNTDRIIKKQSYKLKKTLLTPFRKYLGFDFTSDQKRVINEIFTDLFSPHPMRRLLQGEVGSGKTVVALSALLLTVENSYLGIVLAPTEILAEQHYLTFRRYLNRLGLKVDLLLGNMKKVDRQKILKRVSSETDIVVGTHALLEKDVDLSRAGLLVIDEQHRFGVRQKAAIIKKSKTLDVLAMSATPIPRAMALTSYGDLDISEIKELPAGRKTPRTNYVKSEYAYNFALSELKKGNFVYIVHPVIDESDKNDWKSVEKRFNELKRTVFNNYKCGILHGRMKSDEKEQIMKKFSNGDCQVLFTTTVIEVGIDVPRATVMIIEDFFRYGLATLHQLRGRIARSHRQPYCFLTGKITTAEARARLKVILNTTDGFTIAEEDLKLRGAGEPFGFHQHGLMDFKLGDVVIDFAVLKKAREYAFQIVQTDSSLSCKENQGLKEKVLKKYSRQFYLADVS